MSAPTPLQTRVLEVASVPDDPDWLARQPAPVIAWGAEENCPGADVVVPDRAGAEALVRRIDAYPLTAMTLVQVLRSCGRLPAAQALDLESLAYATLQSGPEFAAWLAAFTPEPLPAADDGEPILLRRHGDVVDAVLNRPASRNSLSLEVRDALVEALQLLAADTGIRELRISGNGACFSVGGELREFGRAPDPATAHWVRTVHSPARLLAEQGERVTCYLHGACIGSGMELPAFARRVVAHRKTFFQLPELQLGLIPGAGGTVSIARRIGRQRMAWLVLSGRRINAETALQWGLVDELSDSRYRPEAG